MMRVRCPICGRSQRVTEAEAGLPTLCHACGHRFDIPAGEVPDASEPSTADATSAPPIPSDAPRGTTVLWLAAVVIAFGVGIGIGWALHSAPTVEVDKTVLPSPRAESPVPAPPPVATTAPSSAAVLRHPTTTPSSRPTTPTPPPPAIAAAPPEPRPPRIFPVVPPSAGALDLDQQIGRAIDRGTGYLLSRFKTGSLAGYDDLGKVTYSGLDALACYAVLQAGEATHDPHLSVHSPQVEAMLDALNKLPLDKERDAFPPTPGNPFTYAHSLRAAALAVFDRKEDRYTLRSDAAWLLRAEHKGAYTYGVPPKLRGSFGDDLWDNSNSQYGALGVWAALQNGMQVPSSYWSQVQQHWLKCQLPNGQWGYSPGGGDAELSMTVAGITTLFVTQDQLSLYEQATTLGRPPFIPALAHGLAWLEDGDNSVSLPFTNRTYNLYGLERAALASGFKYFGTHDWYRELATGALRRQMSDGSWQEEDSVVDTAFTLLFLSRGRHPILMNKLRFDGFWSNRPRDLANLSAYATQELERPLNWQVVSLASDWTDWTDSPILFIASHEPIKLTEDDLDKLRQYAENGGLIYLQTDGQSQQFDRFATDLAKRLFPQYPLQPLPSDHPLFSTQYPLKNPPKVEGVSKGSRLLLIHCESDVNRVWQLRNWSTSPADFQFGVNVFIYAAGKSDFLNKLAVAYVPPPEVTPVAAFPIARLRYAGNCDPEPASLQHWARLFLSHTSLRADVTVVDLEKLKTASTPLAVLTGTAAAAWSPAQVRAVHEYVSNGGVLVVDATGGSAAFADSAKQLLIDAFPKEPLSNLPEDDPVMTSTYTGMKNVHLRLRSYASEQLGVPSVPLQGFSVGDGRVLFSDYDLTTGWLGASTYPIDGYTPVSAGALLDNVALWALERPAPRR